MENSNETDPKPKKLIGFKTVLAFLIMLTGGITLFESVNPFNTYNLIARIFGIIYAFIAIPKIGSILENKLNFALSTWLKVIIGFISLSIIGHNTYFTYSNLDCSGFMKNHNKKYIYNLTRKESVTLTEKELAELKKFSICGYLEDVQNGKRSQEDADEYISKVEAQKYYKPPESDFWEIK